MYILKIINIKPIKCYSFQKISISLFNYYKAEKLFFVIECELITQLENPLIDTKLKTCKVNKKSFINWKNKQNKIIFYD